MWLINGIDWIILFLIKDDVASLQFDAGFLISIPTCSLHLFRSMLRCFIYSWCVSIMVDRKPVIKNSSEENLVFPNNNDVEHLYVFIIKFLQC